MKTIQFETFANVNAMGMGYLTQDNPSCFNGMVRVVKYKVTIEEVPETDETIRDRIQELWDKCDNIHHRAPLRKVAAKYGLELKR